jgi:hypothetical protein
MLTYDEAIAFYDSGAWQKMGVHERALFQMEQNLLCMPFDEFHKAVEQSLGRPVFTHEFAISRDRLLAQLRSKQ